MSDCLSLNATASRIAHHSREKEERRAQERRRGLLYLIAAFLWEQGYSNTAEAFEKDAQLSQDVQVCDNIDLENIILEYSDYYYAKFNKYPKLCKNVEYVDGASSVSAGNKKRKCIKSSTHHVDENNVAKNKDPQKSADLSTELNFGLTGIPIFPSENNGRRHCLPESSETAIHRERTLKPIKDLYPNGSEWAEIADHISREIILKDLNVHWDDVKGLDECKKLLKEATVYAIKYSKLFNSKLGAWNSVLLYGPPGTGKTMLAKAVASECRCTFFNITASSIISKWRGDSEKYVRVLVDLARYYAPTIIFIDEIDWTTSTDHSASNSEPARRFRAEFLGRLDGLLSTQNDQVILLAATNIPWNIDAALLRRLEVRIFVDLPDYEGRAEILSSYLDPKEELRAHGAFKSLIRDTEGYSCADLKLLCKEASMIELRPIFRSLESKEITIDDVHRDDVIRNLQSFHFAMRCIKPSVKHMREQYMQWNQKFRYCR